MTVLVHITDIKYRRSIERLGLRVGRSGVYALPVTGDFMASHQWSRELKRGDAKIPIAVYFRLPDATKVRAGRYNDRHRRVTLKKAVALYLQRDQPQGFEIIIDQNVPRASILKIKQLRRPVGWRFYPEAKGREPMVGPYLRGEYGAARIRARLDPEEKIPSFEALKRTIENSDNAEEISEALWDLARKSRRASCAFLEPLLGHPDPDIRTDLSYALESFSDPQAAVLLQRLSRDEEPIPRSQLDKDPG